ncbi:hypothetical protein C7475_11558 [Chitinophaga sp. S165]|nr:hypothetical protein C7475_11558 [Chitinophaga sp. S165]
MKITLTTTRNGGGCLSDPDQIKSYEDANANKRRSF